VPANNFNQYSFIMVGLAELGLRLRRDPNSAVGAHQKPSHALHGYFYFPGLQKQDFDTGKEKSQTILSGFCWSG
jgi:hypothetical protein